MIKLLENPDKNNLLLTIGNLKNINNKSQIGIYLQYQDDKKKDRALEDRKAWEDYIKM